MISESFVAAVILLLIAAGDVSAQDDVIVFRFTQGVYSVDEPNCPLTVGVELVTGVLTTTAEIIVETMATTGPGSALETFDFISTDVTLIFPIGTVPFGPESIQTFEIAINDDLLVEEEEMFRIREIFLSPMNATIENDEVTASISSEDILQVGIEFNQYTVSEGRADQQVCLVVRGNARLSPEFSLSTDVVFNTTSIGQAESPMDFTPLNNERASFNSSSLLACVLIPITDDALTESPLECFDVVAVSDSSVVEIISGEDRAQVCISDDDKSVGRVGGDPHFSITLPGGRILCYTVQGEHGFSFNLIANKKMIMNAKFVPDSRREEVTWLGSMGIIVQDSNYKASNATKLRFDALNKNIYIGDKAVLQARNIEKMIFKNGKLTISEAPPHKGLKYPSVFIDLQDVEVTFTMIFKKEHLDIFWHKTGEKMLDSHGLIGQFFRKGVEIDEVRKILIMPNKEPVPVMRRPVWSFMERETLDDQLCWTAMNPGYQGKRLIDGTYLDYLVDDVMTTDFNYKMI